MASFYIKDPLLAMFSMGMASFCNDLTMPVSWSTCMDVGHRGPTLRTRGAERRLAFHRTHAVQRHATPQRERNLAICRSHWRLSQRVHGRGKHLLLLQGAARPLRPIPRRAHRHVPQFE